MFRKERMWLENASEDHEEDKNFCHIKKNSRRSIEEGKVFRLDDLKSNGWNISPYSQAEMGKLCSNRRNVVS